MEVPMKVFKDKEEKFLEPYEVAVVVRGNEGIVTKSWQILPH
jgi:hypothetical protein